MLIKVFEKSGLQNRWHITHLTTTHKYLDWYQNKAFSKSGAAALTNNAKITANNDIPSNKGRGFLVCTILMDDNFSISAINPEKRMSHINTIVIG